MDTNYLHLMACIATDCNGRDRQRDEDKNSPGDITRLSVTLETVRRQNSRRQDP
jgi:hypothetical protein